MASQTSNKYVIKIAFTGHRDVLLQDKEIFIKRLTCELNKLRSGANAIIIMYNAMAEGADLWAAECLQKQDYLIVLDFDEEDKSRSFEALNVNIKREFIGLPYVSQDTELKYTTTRDVLLRKCNNIIAAWDGLFIGEPGGTSDVIKKAIASKKPYTIFQLLTPRLKNKYPVAAFMDEAISVKDRKYNRIPFALHYSWIKANFPTKIDEFIVTDSLWKSQSFFTYLLPGILIFITLLFGTVGFWLAYEDLSGGLFNNIFRAVNLITFNNSVFEPNIRSNLFLEIARITGLIIVFIAAVYGMSIAFKKQRTDFKLWRWSFYGDYTVVCGLNDRSYALIKDIIVNRHRKVIVFVSEPDNKYLTELSKVNTVIIFKEDFTSRYHLNRAKIESAKQIFIYSYDETANARCIQEINIILEGQSVIPKIFILLTSESKRKLIHDSVNKNIKSALSLFDINENIVRRLLVNYPVDRFYQNEDANVSCVYILGYEEIGQQIVKYLLKNGHYKSSQKLEIKVMCSNIIGAKQHFDNLFPLFKKISSLPEISTNLEKVLNYTWENVTIHFCELGFSAYDYINEDSELLKGVKANQLITVYSTFPNGVDSVTLLNDILPTLNQISLTSNINIQVYCYYNFPDKTEERVIENIFNIISSNIFTKCFGNDINECTLSKMEQAELDIIPKLINAGYSHIDFKNNTLVDKAWNELSEGDKMSNRYAADHIWTKIRAIWKDIKWQIDPATMRPLNMLELLKEGHLISLGEMEHRRWCADLLTQNFVPLEYDSSCEYNRDQLVIRWNNKNDNFKKNTKAQKKHVDLMPMYLLHGQEVVKDEDQILRINDILIHSIKI